MVLMCGRRGVFCNVDHVSGVQFCSVDHVSGVQFCIQVHVCSVHIPSSMHTNRQNIRGVPYFVIQGPTGREVKLSGAQSVNAFKKAFHAVTDG